MDLAKANPRTIATLIFKGRRELGEVPGVQRASVEEQIAILKSKQHREQHDKLKFAEVKKLYTKKTGDKSKKSRADMIETLCEEGVNNAIEI